MIKRKELIESFEAISQHGFIYNVHIYQNILDANSTSNNAEIKGLKEAFTYPDMIPCNRIDENTFQVIGAGIIKRINENNQVK